MDQLVDSLLLTESYFAVVTVKNFLLFLLFELEMMRVHVVESQELTIKCFPMTESYKAVTFHMFLVQLSILSSFCVFKNKLCSFFLWLLQFHSSNGKPDTFLFPLDFFSNRFFQSPAVRAWSFLYFANCKFHSAPPHYEIQQILVLGSPSLAT